MMLNNSIKLVMWDYGGVLTESPIKKFNDFEAFFNLPTDSIIKINSNNKYNNAWAMLEKNLITVAEFSILFKKEAKKFGISEIEPFKLLECLDLKLNKNMVKLLEQVSHKYSCICLTNNFKQKESKNFKSVKKNFFHIFESSKLSLRKPEKEIYFYILKKLEVKPNEVLFIDDLGVNLKPAQEIGFITYKHIDSKTTVEYIKSILKI
jgi:putative hydrolase of the HAD superfamily